MGVSVTISSSTVTTQLTDFVGVPPQGEGWTPICCPVCGRKLGEVRGAQGQVRRRCSGSTLQQRRCDGPWVTYDLATGDYSVTVASGRC